MGTKDDKYKEVELRSEEVQEVMSRVPSWILRYGITLLFIIVMLLFAGSYFFKYPDVMQADITIMSLEPPVSVIARSTGRVDDIFVKNNQFVIKGQPLAVVQNTANTKDMLQLLGDMKIWKASGCLLDKADNLFSLQSVSLGNIQSAYAVFLNCLNDFRNYKKLNYYSQKINSQQQQLIVKKEYYTRIVRQNPIIAEQYYTTKEIFARDSLLFRKKLISENEYDLSKSNFLQNKQAYLSFDASLKQSELQLMQGNEGLLDLRQQALEQESKYILSLHNAIEVLNAQIKEWEHDYLMSSPITGTVNQMNVWSTNQNVSSGEIVFTVVPVRQNIPKGKAMLPIQGAGKVKVGQKVNVRINNFPDQEFGYLRGKVSGISSIPITLETSSFYVVDVAFPEGMKTNYGRVLPVTRQMQGSADIITDDLRLIERLLLPIKKILKEQE